MSNDIKSPYITHLAFFLYCAQIGGLTLLVNSNYCNIRELSDMMSASEGEGGHGKADEEREVA